MHTALVTGTLLLALVVGCGEGGDAQAGAGSGGKSKAATSTVKVTNDGSWSHIDVTCPDNDKVKLIAPKVDDPERWCIGGKVRYSAQMTGRGAVASFSAVVVRVGIGAEAVELRAVASPADWKHGAGDILPVEGAAATPGVLVSTGFSWGTATVSGGKLRFQIVLPAGTTLGVEGKDVALAPFSWTRKVKNLDVNGTSIEQDVTEDAVKGVVEVDIAAAVAAVELPAYDQTWSSDLPLARIPFKCSNASGTRDGELEITLDTVDAAAAVGQGPVWFVQAGGTPGKSGVLVAPGEAGPSGYPFGKGKLADLGVVVVTQPATRRSFSPCRYQGGYTVERYAYDTVARAHDPRTGKVLAEKKISAKAPKCDRSIGVTSSTSAVMASSNSVDRGAVSAWALSLVP